jgi:PAS domain S-box-containing protein
LSTSVFDTAVVSETFLKSSIRVLHVDDDVVFLKTIKRYLETNKIFHVENSYSVFDAVKKLRQEKYNVILSDYQMPLKNGLEFLSMLRAGGDMTPFILVTVKEKAEVVERALNLGVFRYVEKHGDIARVCAELSDGIQQAHNQHENEEWFRAIYDNQQSGIVIIEPSTHTIVGANTAALDMIGAKKEQIIGSACHTVICPTENGKCPFTDLGQTFNKAEKVLTRLNSKKIPILSIARKATVAGKEYVIESFIDISEHKLEEQELEESRKKFVALFFENPEAVVFCDKNFRAVDVNPSFTSLFGCSSDYMKGRDAVDIFTPENLKNETNKQRLFQKGAGKGTGYGLYLIKRICEMYGWTLQETGEPGKGVRFVMKIP